MSVVAMLVLASFFMMVAIAPGVAAAVTTGATVNFVPSSTPYIRDDSSAIPIFAFGASSTTGDRLSRVEVTFELWDMDTGELKDLNTDASVSGLAIVRDDGTVDDELDEDDTPVDASSINWLGGWPLNTVRADFNALANEVVPATLVGSYQWFVVIRTDNHIDNGDIISARIYSNAIDYSDGSNQPAGTVYSGSIYVEETEYFDVGTGYMTASDAQAQLALRIVDGGPYETFDRFYFWFANGGGFTQTDLAPITTSASTSGVALYRNDGDSVWDSGDTPVDCTSVDTSAWPTIYLYPDDEEVPDSPLGTYEYWVVVRTSSTIGHNDRFWIVASTSSIRINGTIDDPADRLLLTPEAGNDDNEYIQADTQSPVLNSYYWSESSSYLQWTGGTLWFGNSMTSIQQASLVASVSDSWTGVDYVHFSYESSLDSGGYYDYSPTYFYTYGFESWDTDASAPITITMRDIAGNVDTYDVRYAMDTTAPTVTITSPVDLDTLSGTVAIRATATDSQAGVRYNSARVSWDGFSWYAMPWDGTHFTYSWDTTVLPDGPIRVVVQVWDEVNNVGSARANVYLDNTGPKPTIHWPAPGQYMHSAQDLYVVASASDFSTVTSMEARLGSGGWTAMTYDAVNGTWVVNLGAPGAGNLDIFVRGTDAEGNVGPTAFVRAIGDANDPTVTLDYPSDADEVGKTITIKVTAADAERLSMVKVYVSGTTTMLLDATYNPATGFYEVTLDTTTLTDGAWTVAAVAFDQAGRYTITTPASITVDNTEPTLAITGPTDGSYVYGTITITATAADTGSGFDSGGCALSIDGGVWALMTAGGGGQYTYALDTTALADGVHTIVVGAVDDAGNLAVRSVRIVVDNTQPSLAVVAPVTDEFVEGTYTFSVSALDNMGIANVSARIAGPSSTMDVALGFNAASGYYEWKADTTAWADGSYTIKPFATELTGRAYLGAAQVRFRVDNNAPSLVVVEPMDGAIILSDTYQVTVRANDAVFGLGPGDVEWRVDANPWSAMNAGTSDWTATWLTTDYADGLHTLGFRATDAVGHTVLQTITVTVDNTDPTVALNTPSENEYVEGVYTFSARAWDGLGLSSVEMYFSFSGPAPLGHAYATYNPSTGYWELKVDTSTLPDGPASMIITATDTSGRQSSTQVYDFAVDNTFPTFLLVNPSPGEIVLEGSLEVLLNASDPGFDLGDGNVEYNLDGTGWIAMGNLTGEPSLWGLSLNTSAMADGEHTLAFRVTDLAGHVTSGLVTFVVDNTDPTSSIMAPSPGGFVMGTYRFLVAANDALGISQVRLSFTGIDTLTSAMANFNPASGLWEFIIDTDTLDDAEATVSAVATDSSGRTSAVAGPVAFTIDNNAPEVTFTDPVEGKIITEGSITVTVLATDAFFVLDEGDVRLSIDGGAWMLMTKGMGTTFGYDWNTSGLADGHHNLMVRSEDRAGHMGEAAINVIVDNNDPSLAIVSPTDGQFVTGVINFQVSSSDSRGVTRVTLDWGAGSPVRATVNTATNYYEHSLDTTTLPDGTYELAAISVDGSGRLSEARVEFHVDNTEPELVFHGPLTGAILDGDVVVTASATDTFIDSLQFSVDGVGWVDMVDGEGTFDSTLFADGEHTITVRAVDGSGKESTASSIVTFDNTAPVISVADFPDLGQHLAGDVMFALFSADTVGVVSVTVTIGDESWPVYINPQTGFYEWTLVTTSFADGDYDLEFASSDAAGHLSSIGWNVFLDNTAPAVVDSSPREDATVQGIVRFEVTATDDTGVLSVLLRIGKGPWITMAPQEDGTYLHKWETTSDDDQEDLEYTIRVTDTLGNTEDVTYGITVDNPANMVFIALAVILIVLILLGVYFMRQREKEGEPAADEWEAGPEDVSADLDELAGLGSNSKSVPSAEILASEVEVELEERELE